MRGALRVGLDETVNYGIIPADAGSTTKLEKPREDDTDHPRGCGEHTITVSPIEGETRIIPADAGSTRQEKRSEAESRDHPRGCGEHPEQSVYPVESGGSSPRMRGAPSIVSKIC